MGRRVLAFFLGFLIGIIFILGAVAGAVYIMLCVVKVEKYSPTAEDYLGDLAHMSVYDIGKAIYALYGEKVGQTDADGNFYTLEQFCENYHIDLSATLNMELPQEVLDIPAFEFFSEGGFDRAMKQIKVSTVPAIMNLFGGKSEDGANNGMFNDTVITELSKFSMFDLMSEEVGVAGVFANVKLADVMPDAFPAEDSDNKLMWAVGQSTIGGVLNGVSGSENIMLQFKEGGAFATLGGLKLTTVLGENQYIDAIMGSGAIFADLIADDGSIRFDDIINGVSVGELLGCQKHEIADVTGYTIVAGDPESEDQSAVVMALGEGEETVYVMGVNGEQWYEAELTCKEDDTHSHGTDCYNYVWYSTSECLNESSEHIHANGDMLKEGVYYPRVTGLYAVLSNLSIADLTSGNDDELIKQIKQLKISDVLDENVNGVMSALVDLTIDELMNGAVDDLYLGEFFNYERVAIADVTEYGETIEIKKANDTAVTAYYIKTKGDDVAMSLNGKDWYKGKLDCDKKHLHEEDCYVYLWYNSDKVLAEGVQGKLASKQIYDLQHLNDEVQKFTLTDVFGEGKVPSMLTAIAHVRIGELNEHIDTLLLGDLLEYTSELTCENDDPDHVHDHDCYVWTDKNGNTVTGMMAKLAIKPVGEMHDLVSTIKEFTLLDVLGENGIPAMLKSLSDKEIGKLNEAIKTMQVGDFLEYEKRYTCGHEDNAEHDKTCEYAWYKLECTNAENGHVHGDTCYTEVIGMMAKIADKTVNEIRTMDEIVQELTLRDVLGDKLPKMLEDVADKPVNALNGAIENIYLGSALSYSRKIIANNADEAITLGYTVLEVETAPYVRANADGTLYVMSEDGIIWYEAIDDGNRHNYKYVWYDDENCVNPVTGIVKAFVNSKVGNMNDAMKNATLGEMGIGGNNILDALQDTKIVDIGAAINDIKMGVVLGFEKHYVCGQTEGRYHTHSDETCAYVWINKCNGTHDNDSDHEAGDKHYVINGENYYEVKGLNYKIAEKSVKDMTGSGLTDIATSLTIGDLIDSGMMQISNEQGYKFAIIYCDSKTDGHENCDSGCSFVEYMTLKLANDNLSAQTYWESKHDETYAAEHKDDWKQVTLNQFMNMLLSAI